MERERRYTVIKHKDAVKFLSKEQLQALCEIDSTINFGRQQEDRGLLNVVVVESDWPEYEPTWKSIESRVMAELEDAATCEHGFLVGCPTC